MRFLDGLSTYEPRWYHDLEREEVKAHVAMRQRRRRRSDAPAAIRGPRK
jgi:hypothetical protein